MNHQDTKTQRKAATNGTKEENNLFVVFASSYLAFLGVLVPWW
jgi:hypothetical protein